MDHLNKSSELRRRFASSHTVTKPHTYKKTHTQTHILTLAGIIALGKGDALSADHPVFGMDYMLDSSEFWIDHHRRINGIRWTLLSTSFNSLSVERRVG